MATHFPALGGPADTSRDVLQGGDQSACSRGIDLHLIVDRAHPLAVSCFDFWLLLCYDALHVMDMVGFTFGDRLCYLAKVGLCVATRYMAMGSDVQDGGLCA